MLTASRQRFVAHQTRSRIADGGKFTLDGVQFGAYGFPTNVSEHR